MKHKRPSAVNCGVYICSVLCAAFHKEWNNVDCCDNTIVDKIFVNFGSVTPES